MRKIESETIRVVRETINRADRSGQVWKSGNMEIRQTHDGVAGTIGYYRLIEVWLFGNRIAIIEPDIMRMSLSDCGRKTATTKSRLNALLAGFARGRARVSQSNRNWFIDGDAWDGSYECAII